MREEQHSPEPFSARETEERFLIRDSFGDSIAGMAKRTGDHPVAEQAANCALLLAAPGLLKACRLILVWSDEGKGGLPNPDDLDAAVKATREAVWCFEERFHNLQPELEDSNEDRGVPQ